MTKTKRIKVVVVKPVKGVNSIETKANERCHD